MTSTIKVNNIQNQCGQNIINENSNTITIGASGDTIALASGASQSGFGREGSVDWQTGSIKTSTFTATSGEGYFVDTSSGAVTANLPAGSAGAIVSFADYTRTFQTNNLTVSANGSEKIGGVVGDATLSTEGQAATFVYVDATEGWINVQETSNSVQGQAFITATGGNCVTTVGNCKIHTFTSPGTFCVSSISTTAADNTVSYLVIGGGGAGGSRHGGGGGAGGFREVKSPTTPYTASPLDGYPSAPNRVTITATAFPITVGGGGPAPGEASGSNSVFSTITSAGGGAGRQADAGVNGGSGGGGSGPSGGGAAGSGNTPPVSPSQGNPGGVGGSGPAGEYNGGGGGGAGQTGGAPGPTHAGGGGDGSSTSITGSSVQRAGGGGGGSFAPQGNPRGNGGAGNGGGGRGGSGQPAVTPQSGTANTGGGGGGAGGNDQTPQPCAAGNGGSGIVVIRYKFQ